MRVMKFISVAVIVILVSALAVAQQTVAENKTSLKHVPITSTPSNSGKEMFNSYCAVCHGKDAKGSGPTDLTALAKSNGGKYPAAHVAAILRGQASTPSHGSQDMPIWGPLFSSLSQGHESQVQQRITNLVNYVEGVQSK